MKFKRTKPNYEPWKRRPTPKVEPVELGNHIERTVTQIIEILAPLATTLEWQPLACLTYGHRYDEYFSPGEVVCLGCGRTRDSIEYPSAQGIRRA